MRFSSTTSGPSTFEKRAIAQTPAGRVVDALHLGDRFGMLADLDRERDVVAAAAGIVRIGDLDGGRLEIAPPPIAALRLPGLHREDHALARAACRCRRVDSKLAATASTTSGPTMMLACTV